MRFVKGFGNVAAAAQDPAQAMKTLSMQATQMAAKPKVQWEDFKLILEQTPAGMSKVAKAMGMTTTELVKNVQDGKIKTEDFFKAMEKLSTDKELSKMAQSYKTTKEHSPSRVTRKIGAYLSEGLVIGMESKKHDISRMSAKLANMATLSPSRMAFAGDYSLNDTWDYTSTANYEITVVSELDGKVVSKQLAPTMQQEQNRLTTRANRRRGIR